MLPRRALKRTGRLSNGGIVYLSHAEGEAGMTAQIMAFPLARRRAFIVRQAGSMSTRSEDLSERYLAQQLRLQADALLRKGIAPAMVDHEVAALERAIRDELFAQIHHSQGGVA